MKTAARVAFQLSQPSRTIPQNKGYIIYLAGPRLQSSRGPAVIGSIAVIPAHGGLTHKLAGTLATTHGNRCKHEAM